MEIRSFPIQTPYGTFTEDELEKFVARTDLSGELYHDYAAFVYHEPFIFTTEVRDFIQRYNLLKNHGIYSYSQNLDELPAKWVDVILLIDCEYQKATEDKKQWQ
jgi:hypothetical protein